MKIYAIGGLGADERVFRYLNLDVPIVPLIWIDPAEGEELKAYCGRLSKQIDSSEEFGIIGVSFGGIVAVELNKILNPKITILISSVSTSRELPASRVLGKIGILSLIPNSIMKPPQFVFNYLFGATNRDLLKEIISDTDRNFIRWALGAIINWESDARSANIHRIHGTHDRLIPLIGRARKIEKGGHFMIVDKAKELSTIINDLLKSYS